MLDAIESLKERWFWPAGGARRLRPNENRADRNRRFVTIIMFPKSIAEWLTAGFTRRLNL